MDPLRSSEPESEPEPESLKVFSLLPESWWSGEKGILAKSFLVVGWGPATFEKYTIYALSVAVVNAGLCRFIGIA